MAVRRRELEAYCNKTLNATAFADYCYNGVQVEGCDEIHSIASACTASLSVCQEAVRHHADALLVHHGFIWGGIKRIDGMTKNRLACMLQADCSLFGYHLPLDADPQWGNNRVALDRLHVPISGSFSSHKGQDIGLWGTLQEPITAAALQERCTQVFQHDIIHCPGDGLIRTVGIITGGGHSLMHDAIDLGLDAFICGESSEPCFHQAAETGCHFFACGHHATEDIAIHLLCKHLAETFDLTHHVIQQDNPL